MAITIQTPEQLRHAPAGSVTTATRARRTWVVSAMFSNSSLAMLDQVIVSGSRFLTTVLVGRAAGASQLGVYTIAFAAVILWSCAQEALITTPYAVFANRLAGKRRALYLGGTIVQHFILSVTAMVVLGAAACILHAFFQESELARVFALLVLAVPLSLMRELARRISFAHMHMGAAVLLDGVAAALQIGLLVSLVSTGFLSAASAFAAISIACLLTGVTWLVLRRNSFAIRRRSVGRALKKNWTFGRWMFAGQVAGATAGYMPTWILALVAGTTAAGVFAACEQLALLSNPLILGFANFMYPKSAIAFSRGGSTQLSQVIRGATLTIVASMFLLVAGLMLFGDHIVTSLFGAEYAGHGVIISVLAICMPVWAVSCILSSGLCAMDKPHATFAASFCGLVINIIGCAVLSSLWGPVGAAWGLLAGSAVAMGCLYFAFVGHVRETKGP